MEFVPSLVIYLKITKDIASGLRRSGVTGSEAWLSPQLAFPF